MSRESRSRELCEHHAAAFGWALACCDRQRLDAEEVLQISYLKVLDGRAKFGGRSSFKTWLFGIIRITAVEQRRRRVLERMGLVKLERPSVSSSDADPCEAVERSQDAERLIVALSRL